MTLRSSSGRSSAGAGGSVPEVGHLPPKWEPAPLVPSLPIGVAVLAILVALIGILLLVSAILTFLSIFGAAVIPAGIPLLLASADELGAAILLVLGAALIAVARAMWNLETWSLYLSVVVVFAGLTYLFFTASITVLFLILLVVFVYLLTVRHHFY